MNTSAQHSNVEESGENREFDGLQVIDLKHIDLINGLPGFEHLHAFVLAELEGYAPFCAFQSVDEPDISMLMIDAKLLKIWQEVDLPPRELEILGLDNKTDSKQYVILKVDQGTQEFTANIKAPIVFNPISGAANQVILDNINLSVEHPLTNELA